MVSVAQQASAAFRAALCVLALLLCSRSMLYAETAAPPLINVGPFSTHMTLDEARSLQGAETKCENEHRNEITLTLACTTFLEDSESKAAIAIAPDNKVLEIYRVIPLPTGLAELEVFRQARDHYAHVGRALYHKKSEGNAYLAPEPSEGPIDPTITSLIWEHDDDWELMVSIVRTNSVKDVRTRPEWKTAQSIVVRFRALNATVANRKRLSEEFKRAEEKNSRHRLKF